MYGSFGHKRQSKEATTVNSLCWISKRVVVLDADIGAGWRERGKYELINEVFSLLTLYFMMGFIGVLLDGDMQNEVGLALIGLAGVNFATNFGPILT